MWTGPTTRPSFALAPGHGDVTAGLVATVPMLVGALLQLTLPIQWLFTDRFAWLLVLQLLSGTAWAAFEPASLLSFFERIPPHGQTSVLTLYNLASAIAIVLGSAAGGARFRRSWPAAAASGALGPAVVGRRAAADPDRRR